MLHSSATGIIFKQPIKKELIHIMYGFSGPNMLQHQLIVLWPDQVTVYAFVSEYSCEVYSSPYLCRSE
jgi:hypothetical protein